MDKSAMAVFNAAVWTLKLASLPAFLGTTWIVMRGVLDGLPVYQAMAWGAWALAGSVFLLYGLFLLLDRWYEHRPESLDAKKTANVLRGLHATQHDVLDLYQVFEIWVSEHKSSGLAAAAIRNTRWRVLKAAADQGLLVSELKGATASKASTCRSKDAADFFQSGRWREVRVKDD